MGSYFIGRESYDYEGKLDLAKHLNIVIDKNKLAIYDLKIQKIIITNRVYKKYLKLLKVINFYLESDDETGVALMEALNEIERFRQLVKNKYRAYLLGDVVRKMSCELKVKVKDVNTKLYFIENKSYYNNLENRRSK